MTGHKRTTHWVALLIVVATGVVMGVFVWRTYFGYVPHLYPLELRQGQWLIAPDEAPQGYFRRELFIPGPSEQAWIKVAATDSFVLYLNGKKVDSQGFPMLNVSGIYDVGHSLRVGKNVIGVQVTKVTYPGPAKVVIEGAYRDEAGRWHHLGSDASWQASSRQDSQGNGRIPWYAEVFQAGAWPLVQPAGVPSVAEISPLTIHPDLLTLPPQGKWIGHAHPQVRVAIFQHSFEVIQKVQGLWIRIAADDSYELSINGIPVANAGASDKTLDIYDVGPFLKQGFNTLKVKVAALRHSSPRLLLDAVITQSGQARWLASTDSTWRAQMSAEAPSDTSRRAQSLWEPVVVLADYSAPVDRLTKSPTPVRLPIAFAGKQIVRMLACTLSILVMTLAAWVGFARLIHLLYPGLTRPDALTMDALLHLPCILFLGMIYCLQYDIRYDAAFPYRDHFIYLAIAALWLARVGTLLEAWRERCRTASGPARGLRSGAVAATHRWRTPGFILCVVAIVAVGFTVRWHWLQATSLSHDEASMAVLAKQVLEQGYPAKTIGPIEKPLTTYELLPYPIAVSIRLFGVSDFAVRLPAIILASLTTCLIAYIGRQLWGVWVGLLAAAIYALSPFAIRWGSNAFHPQQAQFFTLLTSYLFFKALPTDSSEIKPGYMYGAAGCFTLTYLTWEGTGLLLPAFLVALLMLKGKDLTWLKCKSLWLAAAMISIVVILQFSRRILLNVPYIVVGKGLSDAGFKLFFIDPMYDPWFYLENFLLSGNHFILTAIIIIGIPLIISNAAIRYHFTLLIVVVILLNNLIPNLSTRYAYFVQPFLVISSAAILMSSINLIWTFFGRISFLTLNISNAIFSVALPLAVLSLTNTEVFRMYRIKSSPDWIVQTLPEVYGIDYRSTDYFLRNHSSLSDVVISMMPQALEYYTGKEGNYYLQSYTDRQIFYDVSETSSVYLDKYIGSRVIRNIQELEEVMNSHKRVYLVATPYSAFRSSNDKLVDEFIERKGRIIYESYKTRVYILEN
jgi:uncharacterized membrane protein